jgi:hypothetical protein
VSLSGNGDHHLVEVPPITRPGRAAADAESILATELLGPSDDLARA